FISIKSALASLVTFVETNTEFLVLIKPQFEAGRGATEKGIIKNPMVWQKVCDDITNWFQVEHNYLVRGIIPSSILGIKGNKEFFIYAVKQ
ncbi:MAG: TlyA family rRNA (cytidine-2'-O)-methyltransferase, partial [Rickettsiaceae bacterium]|nr:TlyA family rRNA (cytidine-2'-O)-methyltransferase [Rickettsiaceae bacterium]